MKARNLFERALTATGLHVVEGSKIWEAYREFEQAILLTIDENDNEVGHINFLLSLLTKNINLKEFLYLVLPFAFFGQFGAKEIDLFLIMCIFLLIG